MCYTVNVSIPLLELIKPMKAAQTLPDSDEHAPSGRIYGFAHSQLPVITKEKTSEIQLLKYGLIPAWAKEDKAAELAKMKFNAREDSIFEKPSCKGNILQQRCLLLVDVFFEWRHEGTKKIPYLITLKEVKPFALGCIYEGW